MRVLRQQSIPLPDRPEITKVKIQMSNGLAIVSPAEPGQPARIETVAMGDVAGPEREESFFQAYGMEAVFAGHSVILSEKNALPPGPERNSARIEVRIAVASPVDAEAKIGNGSLELNNPLSTTVEMTSGNMLLAGTLRQGLHQLRMETGAASLNLDKASSVKYTLHVNVGTLVSPDGVNTSTGAGSSISGQLGSGNATLNVRIQNGTAVLKSS